MDIFFLLFQVCRLKSADSKVQRALPKSILFICLAPGRGPSKSNLIKRCLLLLKIVPWHSSDLKPSTSENSFCPLEVLLPKLACFWLILGGDRKQAVCILCTATLHIFEGREIPLNACLPEAKIPSLPPRLSSSLMALATVSCYLCLFLPRVCEIQPHEVTIPYQDGGIRDPILPQHSWKRPPWIT